MSNSIRYTESEQFDSHKVREALRQIRQKHDRNTGGALLGKRMVHKSAKSYNRSNFKQRDLGW